MVKTIDRKKINRLEQIPNIGKAIAAMLEEIGVDKPEKLCGKNAYKLHGKLCEKQNKHVDNCVIDTFLSAIDFMEGGIAKPWWEFTEERKKHLGE